MTGPRRRILVVDDNRDSADSPGVHAHLRGPRGADRLQVAVTPSPPWGRYEPALIFIDIGMPDLNGYEVTRLIRASRGGGRSA